MEEATKDVNFASPIEEAKYWREKGRNVNGQLFMYYSKFNNFILNQCLYFMTYFLIFQAIQLEKETKEVKEEFQEFQEGSRELEAELETQLEQVNG